MRRYPKSREDFYRENDNVYFNATITHPEVISSTNPAVPTIGAEPFIAEYQVNNDTAFIDNASEYYCSVLRFDIPLDTVPIFICPIIPNQGNYNLTPFIIGIQATPLLGATTNYPRNVIYDNNNNISPPVQDQLEQVITPYYYIYNYTDFIDMVNNALLLAWYDATSVGNPDVPYFFFDESTQLIKLAISPTLSGSTTTTYKIYMNSLLENYFSAFSSQDRGSNNVDGVDFILNTPTIPFKPFQQYLPVGWGILSQQWNVLPLWSSIRKILILSARLPIVAESVAIGGYQ